MSHLQQKSQLLTLLLQQSNMPVNLAMPRISTTMISEQQNQSIAHMQPSVPTGYSCSEEQGRDSRNQTRTDPRSIKVAEHDFGVRTRPTSIHRPSDAKFPSKISSIPGSARSRQGQAMVSRPQEDRPLQQIQHQ